MKPNKNAEQVAVANPVGAVTAQVFLTTTTFTRTVKRAPSDGLAMLIRSPKETNLMKHKIRKPFRYMTGLLCCLFIYGFCMGIWLLQQGFYRTVWMIPLSLINIIQFGSLTFRGHFIFLGNRRKSGKMHEN